MKKYTAHIKQNYRFRLFSKWLLPYVLILFVPLFLNVLAFSIMKNVVHKQTVSTNELILNQIKKDTDVLFTQVRQAVIQLYFSNILDSDTVLKPYDVHNAMTTLKNITSSYPDLGQIIIYNNASDYIITSTNATNIKNYYESYISPSVISYEDFLKMANGNYSGNIITLENINNENTLIYLDTITDINNFLNNYNVFITIKTNTVLDKIADSNIMQNGLFVMLDSKSGKVISSYGNNNLSEHITSVVNNSKLSDDIVLSSTTSDVFDINYHILYPEKIYWKQEYQIQNALIFSVILCLFMGSIIIISSIKTNYNPIKNLAEMIKYKSDQIKDVDDIDSIYTGISEMLTQYSSIMSKQNISLRAAFLHRLLRGREDTNLLPEHLDTYDISFVSDKFAVVLIYIENFDEFFIGAEDMPNDKKLSLSHLTITNIFEELSSNLCNAYYVDLDYTIGYIINFKSNAQGNLADILEKTQNFVKEHFGIRISIAISDTLTHVNNIVLAYNQALEALDYREIMGIETIIEYTQIVNVNNNSFYYPLDMEQHLIDSIKSGDYESAQNILNTIYKNNFEKQTMTLNTARCLVFNIISTMIKAISSNNGSLDDAFMNSDDYITRLFQYNSIQEHKEFLSELLKGLCEYNKNNVKEENNIADKIIEYINNNYKDMNLNVAAVADHFNLHPTYISNIFKKQTGKGLLDYIKNVRIEAAKKLLKERNDTIEVISQECGFSSSKTFTRTFKAITGLTPGKYKTLE